MASIEECFATTKHFALSALIKEHFVFRSKRLNYIIAVTRDEMKKFVKTFWYDAIFDDHKEKF